MCVLVCGFSFDYNAGKEKTQASMERGMDMDLQKTIAALEKKRYTVSVFPTPQAAADYLDQAIDRKTVGFGDSKTLKDMGLFDRLATHNVVYDPNQSSDNDQFLEIAQKTLTTEIFLTSVNAVAETGEMVNLDGTGNRMAGSLFGHRRIYFVIGSNKIVPDLEEAIWRTRNIAAPQNALRLGLRTPCALKGGNRCYDCMSRDRICNALAIYFRKMNDIEDVEVILIDAEMGF